MTCIDIIVPAHNEEAVLEDFWKTLKPILARLNHAFQVIFVDDGSTDKTVDVVTKLMTEHNVKDGNSYIGYISLVRNYGKEAALLAGLQNSKGDYTIIMDADLQDPPSLIPELIHEATLHQYEIVYTRRVPKQEKLTLGERGAALFYKLTDMPSGLRDYCIFNKAVRERLLSLPEHQRFTRYLLRYVAPSSTKIIDFPYTERVAGESKWPLPALINYAWDGIVCLNTQLILKVQVIFALICAVLMLLFPTALVLGTYLIYTTVIGIYYLNSIYINTRQRPSYFIREIRGIDNDN